jgi:hypothetical protein
MSPHSDFHITAAPLGDILVVTFAGQSTDSNAQAMTRRYFELVLASGLKNVLADIRSLQGRLSAAKTYFLMRELPVNPVPTDIKTAVVESAPQREYARFLETTAANAGVYFRCFLDYGDALAWLGERRQRVT